MKKNYQSAPTTSNQTAEFIGDAGDAMSPKE